MYLSFSFTQSHNFFIAEEWKENRNQFQFLLMLWKNSLLKDQSKVTKYLKKKQKLVNSYFVTFLQYCYICRGRSFFVHISLFWIKKIFTNIVEWTKTKNAKNTNKQTKNGILKKNKKKLGSSEQGAGSRKMCWLDKTAAVEWVNLSKRGGKDGVFQAEDFFSTMAIM